MAENDGLARATLLFAEELENPEHFAVATDGTIYTGTVDGVVHRIHDAHGSSPRLETLTRLEGRPLGMRFARGGDLIVAAGLGGLVAVDPAGGVRQLAPQNANSVDIATDGTIYFTESTSQPDRRFPLGMLEQRPYGTLFALRPGEPEPEALLEGLIFANGVALTADEASVLVVESFRYRVHRYWLAGPQAGSSEVWADNLPGIPDNLSSDRQGAVWVAFNAPRNDLLDTVLHPRPWLKDQVGKLAPLIRATGGGVRYGLVAEYDEDGFPQRSLHDASGGYMGTSGAVSDPERGVLYVGSLFDSGLLRVDLG